MILHTSDTCILRDKGMTNLLMGTDLTPQQLEYVKIAQASGNALV